MKTKLMGWLTVPSALFYSLLLLALSAPVHPQEGERAGPTRAEKSREARQVQAREEGDKEEETRTLDSEEEMTAPGREETSTRIEEGESVDDEEVEEEEPAPEEETEDPLHCGTTTDREIVHFEEATVEDLIGCIEAIRALDPSPNQLKTLARAEDALRARGDQILNSITEYQKLQFSPTLGDTERAEAFQKVQDLQKEITWIKTIVTFSDKKLFVNFADYDDYFFRFNAGYEFVAIDKFFDKGLPRAGFLVNLKLGGTGVTDKDHGWKPGLYGGRFALSAILNSSAEKTPTSSEEMTDSPMAEAEPMDDPAPDDAEVEPDVKQTLDFELQFFKPLHRTVPKTPNDLRSYFGPLLVAGGLKTDDNPHLDERFYGGVRFAINPELYADFLFGKTGSLRSKRIELRGQLPVRLFANGDRLYLGAIGNFGVDSEKDEVKDDLGEILRAAEPDAIRVYISWNADLTKLFGGGNSGK